MEAIPTLPSLSIGPDGLISGFVPIDTSAENALQVEITLAHGWRAKVAVDPETRAFSVHAPAQAFPDGIPLAVTARVIGSDQVLAGSGVRIAAPLPLQLLAGDIVNNCNLRCPFCITDYALTKGTKQMDVSTFAHAIRLAPLLPESAFWLSCMHEPSLNPAFPQFLRLVPPDQRRKISFTTNFAKRLDDEFLQALAESGAHSIRISIDSQQPDLFAQLRKGARFDIFHDNLIRFAALLRQVPNSPRLHVITMAFKDNLSELAELVRWCHEQIGAWMHEIRFMYYLPHVADWGVQHILDLAEWEQLKHDLQALPMGHSLAFGEPQPDAHRQFREKPGADTYEHPDAVFGGTVTPETYRRVDPLETGFPVPNTPLNLRMRWDGLIMAEQLPEDAFRCNVLHLDDPITYFHRLRAAAPLAANSPWQRIERRDRPERL